MHISDAITNRRSIRKFTDRPVTREDIENVLAAAALAPNHRLTEPWRFYVMGPEARYSYGVVLGDRKARKLTDPDAIRKLRESVGEEHRARPSMIAVATTLHDDPEIREEDYAAVMMAIQNLTLSALELGLGTHIRTGAILASDECRAAIGVPADQRLVATIALGEPAELPPTRPRTPATEHTSWLP